MFHPLLPDLTSLKDSDLESKIAELTKKYVIAGRSGNGDLCNQILLALNGYKSELQRRTIDRGTKVSVNNQDKDLDNLINVN